MKVNPNIFKAYDIRGVYPEELNEQTSYLIGRAFVRFLKKKNLNIAVGRDNRLSSNSLFKALVIGITEEGGNVVNIGLSPSPVLYWAGYHYKFDGGINITASHNPPEYNGFKLIREKANPISAETGIKNIYYIAQEIGNKIGKKTDFAPLVAVKKAKLVKKEVIKEYIRFNLSFFNLSKIKKIKIVVDTANCVGGALIDPLFKHLNCQIVHIFKKLDGSFPNHLPDPLKEENIKLLKKEVLLRKADLGVAFDGDADRVVFVDEKGELVRGDLITALMAELFLRENSGEKILYDLRSSNVVPESIKKNNGIPICYKIGHSFIKEKIRKENILFAGELSGHYYSKEHYFLESPIFVILKILEKMSLSKKKLSELISFYKKYYYSGEINFKVKEKEKIMAKLEKKFKLGKVLKLDGLRVDFKDWWFLVRPSNTEPVIRLVIEATTKKLMKEKVRQLSLIIKGS